MKTSTILKYILLGIFNALMFYIVPLAISYESWFLLLIIGIITFLINITYITNRLKPLKWITPGFIFLLSFVLFPAGYNFYVSFTNWQTGHILTKTQVIERLEDLTYSTEEQRGVEFDLYVMQDSNLDFFFLADFNQDNLLFGKAVTSDQFEDIEYATHEPSFKDSKNNITVPESLYLLSGKEQIANSSTLQDLSLSLIHI